MKTTIIDSYTDVMSQVIYLYSHFTEQVFFQVQLELIKALHDKIYTINEHDLYNEIFSNSDGSKESVNNILDLYLYRLHNYICRFEGVSVYDVFGDNHQREKHLYQEIARLQNIGVKNIMSKEEASLYLCHFHLIIERANILNKAFIKDLENLANWLLPPPTETPLISPKTFLPPILSTDRAQKYFHKAIEAGVIVQEGEKYRKGDISKAQLAYFLDLVFCHNNDGKYNNKKFPDKQLSNLFEENRLGQTRSQYISNKNGKPKGYETIDELFK